MEIDSNKWRLEWKHIPNILTIQVPASTLVEGIYSYIAEIAGSLAPFEYIQKKPRIF